MPAVCKCKNGHTWTTRILEDDPSTNSITVEETNCPECESDDFEIIDEDHDADFEIP